MRNFLIIFLFMLFIPGHAWQGDWSGLTLHLSYETEADILTDFLSSAHIYRYAKPGAILENPLEQRNLELANGKFGKALHIKNGWSVTRGTANESGIDLDLIVATMWGDWRSKPHYWGAGRFYGDRGSIAFWVRTANLNPGIVFIQSSIGWGRKERDLLRIDLLENGKLTASIRDVYYQHHLIESQESVWENNTWQHIAVVYDKAFGLKLYHDGEPIASNWGSDSWWQTPLPGLFCPFLPESYYDEIFFFDYPLSDEDVASLYTSNTPTQKNRIKPVLNDSDTNRLLACYGNLANLELPELTAGEEILSLQQTKIANCHDEKIPAWWVMDGRYELAWPHPYMLFTFILGDADFHGDKVDIDLKSGETANFIALEGILEGIEVLTKERGAVDKKNKIIDLNNYPYFFYCQKIDLGKSNALHVPLIDEYGTPPGLVDSGSLKFPLSGKMRLHEIHLWNVNKKSKTEPADLAWPIAYQSDLSVINLRYLDAFLKLTSPEERTLFAPPNVSDRVESDFVDLDPLQHFHFFGPDLNPDLAIDKIGLSFYVFPERGSDILWLKLRDPANPSRIWAQTVMRVEFKEVNKAIKIELELDPIDIMLASDDRLWIELMFANKEKIATKFNLQPKIKLILSRNRINSLSDYVFFEMLPARLQYMKEYNYQPWLFTGEQRDNISAPLLIKNVSTKTGDDETYKMGQKFWTNFGGPYDMWYPPQAVLRHDPNNEIAGIYRRLTGERASIYGGQFKRTFAHYDSLEISKNIPVDAPPWALWQREMYKKQLRTIHWIVTMQRKDGFFWGGSNDDVFIPLGYAGIPFMGDEISRISFLKLYDGIEKLGIFKEGYCDIWPIDYLHITDFLTSRGLMVPYALGNPYVLEREMVTAKVYKDIMEQNNFQRAEQGLPHYEFEMDSDKREPKLWAEKLVQDYELTQIYWYWGKTPDPKPHHVEDRNTLAREMMYIATLYDKTEEYDWTKAMRHTDRQGSAPGRNLLITSALGGRLQGRIEPHPHSIAVSWDNPDPDIARLVSHADQTSLNLNLYNFKSQVQKITMRLWRIQRGEYLLKVASDLNDNGEIDSAENILYQTNMRLDRFSTLTLTIPAKENISVQLTCDQKINKAASLPDLALHPIRDIIEEGNKLIVTVHNIGSDLAKDVGITLLAIDGKIIANKVIPEITAPTDLVPKSKSVTFNLTGKKWYKIVIDDEAKIDEIYEGNNQVTKGGIDTGI